MHKNEFVDYVAKQHNVTKVEADKVIDMFISSVTNLLSEGKEVTFLGFGKFYTSQVAAREGRNPSTGKSMTIEAYVQPRFAVSPKLKAACNGKGDTGAAKKAADAGKTDKKAKTAVKK